MIKDVDYEALGAAMWGCCWQGHRHLYAEPLSWGSKTKCLTSGCTAFPHPSTSPETNKKVHAGIARSRARLKRGEHASCLTLGEAAIKFGVTRNVVAGWVKTNFIASHLHSIITGTHHTRGRAPRKKHMKEIHVPGDAVPNIPNEKMCPRCHGVGTVKLRTRRPKVKP